MSISYCKKNGALYASDSHSYREGNKVKKDNVTYLGKVLDKEKGIYKNRARGVFHYDPKTRTFSEVPADTSEALDPPKRPAPQVVLDFGDVWLINELMKQNKFDLLVRALGLSMEESDTLKTMVSYYMTTDLSNAHVEDWYEGSYACCLYPKARVTGQRISELLRKLGDPVFQRLFFREWFRLITQDHTVAKKSVLIDSTGLPNNIHFPLTAISNHNGKISREARLCYAVDKETGSPVFYNAFAGNIIDMSTMLKIIAEMREAGIDVDRVLLDAGYYCEPNVKALYENNIHFIVRLKSNFKLYKSLVKQVLPELDSPENFVRFGKRFVYIKKVACTLDEEGKYPAFAYVCRDIERSFDEIKNTFQHSENLTDSEVLQKMKENGLFILISTDDIPTDRILPGYYQRQQIEQTFDLCKNYANMLPLSVQSEEAMNGHLLLVFLATALFHEMVEKMKDSVYSPKPGLLILRGQKCDVHPNRIIPMVARKKANDIYKIFKVKPPFEIERQSTV